MKSASYWIRQLNMQQHPEGGWFAESYRSDESLDRSALPPRYGGQRTLSTAIYFLLEGHSFSAFHRIASDEGWHFYAGAPLSLWQIAPDGLLSELRLGPDPEQGQVFQAYVPAGNWFAARPADPAGYTLVGCTVAPGFDFADFELAGREALSRQYPQHSDLIARLTRG